MDTGHIPLDGSQIPLIVITVLLILASAYFSATETAFSSLNRIRMKNLAASGNRRAQLVIELSEQYDKLLSTILIGNNIVNICSASIATVLFTRWCGAAGVTLSTIVMTVLVLIFGEISPKSLAKDAPESFAMASAPILRVLLVLLTPLNALFTQWKRLLRRIFPAKPDPGITEEDLLTIVEEAQSGGALDAQEGELIRSAIEFNDLDVIDVFTPRVSVTALSDDLSAQEIEAVFRESGFSRLPVYHTDIDHVTGILHERDFYTNVLSGQKTLDEVLQQPLFIAPSLKISDLLRLFQQRQTHLAIITDEYGGWQVQGSVRLEKLFETLDCAPPETELSTVNGWALSQLNAQPAVGDSFPYDGRRFIVQQTNGRYISHLEVRPDAPVS